MGQRTRLGVTHATWASGGVRGTAAIGGGETHVTAFHASCIVGEYAGGRI